MKTLKRITLSLLLIFIASSTFVSCNKDDNNGKNPTISYIRVTDPNASDSLLVSGYLGDLIAIMGNDLQNLKELWFNDQQAKLNPAYITQTSIIATIPGTIPEIVTNTMKLVFSDGQTLEYPFIVAVPAPSLSKMLCEYVPAGQTAVILGNFFLPAEGQNEPNVYFAGNIKAEIVSYTMEEIRVIVPDNAGVGKITVESMYGKKTSSFIFRDNTNLILDFTSSSYGNPWGKGGFGTADDCSGQYLNFVGTMGGWSWQDKMMFAYFASAGAGVKPIASGLTDYLAVRFEANVVTWSDAPMIIWFDNQDRITVDEASLPQAHWKPYNKDGVKSEYKTGGWITVTIPLKDFYYNKDESKSDLKIDNIENYTNINFFIFGAADGTYPIDIRIDNVRVVHL